MGTSRLTLDDLGWIQETRVDKLTEEELEWAARNDPSPDNQRYYTDALYRLFGPKAFVKTKIA